MLTEHAPKERIMTDTQNRSAMLAGCRVLDFTQYLAGPTVTRLMAEMGATSSKSKIAPMGDPARLLPTIKSGRSGYFVRSKIAAKKACASTYKNRKRSISCARWWLKWTWWWRITAPASRRSAESTTSRSSHSPTHPTISSTVGVSLLFDRP